MQGVQIPSGSVPTAKEIIAPAASVSSIHDPVYKPQAVDGAAIVPDQLPPTPPVAGLSSDDVTLEVCMHLCIYFSLHLIVACVLEDYSIVISLYAMFRGALYICRRPELYRPQMAVYSCLDYPSYFGPFRLPIYLDYSVKEYLIVE